MKRAIQRERTVLVVEDDPDHFQLLRDGFESIQFPAKLFLLSNGSEAKDYLEKLADSELPACVILDLQMPVMDGFELLDYLKSHLRFRTVPVIVLSASREQGDIGRAYGLGANSYLVKPGTPAAFAVLAQVLWDQWIGSDLLDKG